VTNEELMLAYAQGDASSFETLFDRYKNRIYGYVAKNLTQATEREDVCQSIFLKLHQTKEKYSSQYPFEAWLFIIARSVLFDHLRKSPKVTLEELKEFMIETSTFEKDVQSVDLDGLNEKSKRVMELRYREEKSFDEIAAIINSSSSNVRQMISRSLKFLRKNKEESV
jgi:RNA polymerase sigma-70 factor (ECF subfamily)